MEYGFGKPGVAYALEHFTISPECLRVPRSQLESGSLIFPSKRLLAAAFHKKSNIFGIASSSSAPVTGPSIAFTHTLLKRRA
jgi:hypothetical protein